jgi:hypothetical protein
MVSVCIAIVGVSIIAIAWFQSVKKLIEAKCNLLSLEISDAILGLKIQQADVTETIEKFTSTYYRRRNRQEKKEEAE